MVLYQYKILKTLKGMTAVREEVKEVKMGSIKEPSEVVFFEYFKNRY